MKSEELEQFMVDYHKEDDMVLVNSRWLQSKLLAFNVAKQEIQELDKDVLKQAGYIDSLEEKLQLYKEMLEVYRNIKVLNVKI